MMGRSKVPCPREYKFYHSAVNLDESSHGGSLIYVRNDTPHNPIPLQTSLEAVAVQIHLEKRYTICSVYLSPSMTFCSEDFINLINQLPKPFLILGDLNGRHPLWGDIVSDRRGNQLFSIVEDEDVGLLNSGQPTHFHVQTGTLSVIDLSICSNDVFLDFSWDVLEDRYTSDHFPIIVKLAQSPPAPRCPKWNIKKANWQLFKELSKINANAYGFPTVDDSLDYLNTCYYSAGMQSIPRTSGVFKCRPVPWWSKECQLAHRTFRTAQTRLRHHKTEHNVIETKKARALFRFKIKNARKSSWQSYVSALNFQTPEPEVWKKMRKIAGKFVPSPPPVIKIDDDIIADPKLVASAFSCHFAKISSKENNRNYSNFRLQEEKKKLDFTSHKEEVYNVPFSMREFDYALSKCNESAPGPDDIPYAMIKNSSFETKSFILSIVNRIWKEHIYPKIWELAIFLPFLKPGKNSLEITNYRPIALTSCVGKLMEKMVNARLMWYLEREKLISPAQCGFRRMYSCTDILIRMESSICKAFAAKQHHVTIFFDLEKAYDTTWRYGILKIIHEYGFRGEMSFYIKSFLKNRSFQVKIGCTFSEIRMQEEGVPQGSVLSVTLFALAINGIAKFIPSDIKYTLFVDDLSISFSSTRMAIVERKLQMTIDKINEWAEMHGFRFSSSKTVCMHFCRIRGVHPDPDIFLNRHRIPCVTEARFLGLVFDSRLTWVPHLKQLKTKCVQALNILKVLSHSSWGADRTQMLKLYRSLILSKLSYGCEIFTSATPARLKILDSVHHSGIRLATGAFKSSPIPSLLVDAGEMPLSSHFQNLTIRLWYRIKRLPSSLTNLVVNSEQYDQFYSTHPSFPRPFSYRAKTMIEEMRLERHKVCATKVPVIPPWKQPVFEYCKYFNDFKKNLTDDAMKAIFLEHKVQHASSVAIYTDGSKSSAGAGFGVASADFSYSGRLHSYTSNFTAELIAVLNAIKSLLIIEKNNFTVFCDSLSVLQILESFNPCHPIVQEIFEWLILAKRRGHIIHFCWVPAHVGVEGNERADQLAKAAVTRSPSETPIPFRDFYPAIRKALRKSWEEKWDAIDSNKMREITSSTQPCWSYQGMPRKWETVLCRLRIGHTRLTHGFLMSRSNHPYCDDCLVPLTVKHILCECPNLLSLRNQYLSDCQEDRGNFVLSKILGENVSFNVSGIFKFVEAAGLLHHI